MKISVASEASMKIVIFNNLMWQVFLRQSLKSIVRNCIWPSLEIEGQWRIMFAVHSLFRHLLLETLDAFGWQTELNLGAIVGHRR